MIARSLSSLSRSLLDHQHRRNKKKTQSPLEAAIPSIACLSHHLPSYLLRSLTDRPLGYASGWRKAGVLRVQPMQANQLTRPDGCGASSKKPSWGKALGLVCRYAEGQDACLSALTKPAPMRVRMSQVCASIGLPSRQMREV